MRLYALTTRYYGDTYGVAADWRQPSSQIWALGHLGWYGTPMQVCRYDAEDALRRVIEDAVRAGGDDPDADDSIDDAIDAAEYREVDI